MLISPDPNLLPDHLNDWKKRQVIYKPGEPDDDGQVALWYKTEDGHRIACAALSELMVITGPQKSRKTLLQQCQIMSRYTDDINKTFSFKLDLPDGVPVLYFDTEQPRRRTKKNLRRFHQTCGLDQQAKDYLVYNIKSLSTAQKLEFVTHTITNIQDEMGVNPGMVIIDQIADLCPGRDVNNDMGVDMVYTHLNAWQEMTNDKALFSVIIHTNRGRMNTNGKLGVMLDQKTDCAFHVDINFDNWVSTVTHKEAREARIPKFTFRQDFDGHPRLLVVDDSDFNHI